MQKLEERFRLDLNILEAGNHMRSLIDNAHDKWSTKFYDQIQYLQNKIVYWSLWVIKNARLFANNSKNLISWYYFYSIKA